MKKLIAIDLDGTLLNSKSEISEDNLKALRKLEKGGFEIAIATGRAEYDVKHLCEKYSLNSHIISLHGARVITKDTELLRNVPMDREYAISTIKWLHDNRFYYEVFTDVATFAPLWGHQKLNEEIDYITSIDSNADRTKLLTTLDKQLSQFGFAYIEQMEELINQDIIFYNILVASFEPNKLEEAHNYFIKNKYWNVNLFTSSWHNLELANFQAQKGLAVEELAIKLGIDNQDTIAIGDNYNDLSMLVRAGYSIAMGNSPKDIQEKCDMVTLSNDDSGIAYALEEILKRDKQKSLVK